MVGFLTKGVGRLGRSPGPPPEGQSVTGPPRRLRTPSIWASVWSDSNWGLRPSPLWCVDWTPYARRPVLEPRVSLGLDGSCCVFTAYVVPGYARNLS